MKELGDLYTSMIAWAFLPSFLASVVHRFLLFFRIMKTRPGTGHARQRQIIHTFLLLIYAASEIYFAYEKLPKSYYSILDSAPGDLSSMKKTYRRLSLMYHPDKNPGAEAEVAFLGIRKAYDTLSNPLREKVYNLMGPLDFQNAKIYKDFLLGYAQEAGTYYLSLLVGMGISLAFGTKMRSYVHKILLIGLCMALDVGLVTGAIKNVFPVPAFMIVTVMRKIVLVYCMLIPQMNSIWGVPGIDEKAFMGALDRLAEEKEHALNQIGAVWFNLGDNEEQKKRINDRAAKVLTDIWAKRKEE